MDSVWFTPDLAQAIIENDEIFNETPLIIADILSGNIDFKVFVTNLGGVLTHTEPEKRERGMRFYTKILKEMPKHFLTDMQLRTIIKFYTDRLKDHHSTIPAVLEGYLAIMDKTQFNINYSGDFLLSLFREVCCQSQLRPDRYNYYLIIKKLVEKDPTYCTEHIASDLVYGMISAMDGERDPRNLLFLFNFLPNFLQTVPVGHLVDEMFDVLSCYYPVDFHPSPTDPTAVTRDELADALCPCLCAIPEFGEHCLVLLMEKLDSALKVAKMDSLKLLTESCKTFPASTYYPFLKALWASISREMNRKSDNEIKIASHEALSALVAKLATTANSDQSFENFVKGILISCQTSIAEAKTVIQFVQVARILLSTANASKESCVVVTICMIPAIISYFEFKTSPKLQIASIDFLGDIFDVVKHWDAGNLVQNEAYEIPKLCLSAISNETKEFQIAGFRTLIRVKDVIRPEHVKPLLEILIHNVQRSQDTDILSISVETVHAIARKYPEIIMDMVVKGKCNLNDTKLDERTLQKRLHLLTNLASIDEFTTAVIEDILHIIKNYEKEAHLVVEVLNESMSLTNFYTNEKVAQIESNHGLIEPLLTWLCVEITKSNQDTLSPGFTLVANTVASLSAERQLDIINKYTKAMLEKTKSNEIFFLILECLYSPLRQNVYTANFEEVMPMSMKLALNGNNEIVRYRACALIAHFLNKAEFGQKFELLYEILKTKLSKCDRNNEDLCSRLIHLNGWLTKALLMRGSDFYLFWLQKITEILQFPQYSKHAADAIGLVMRDCTNALSPKQHCRISILYKQRMFISFLNLTKELNIAPEAKENYLLSWSHVLSQTPRSVLNNEFVTVLSITIDCLAYDNKELLLVALNDLHYLMKSQPDMVGSLQTILPRLISLTKYVKSMDVRIKSLECLYEIAKSFRTTLLLPYKQDVLYDLAPSLDDKKRLVRNMAVKARTRWYLVGSPGEDKQD